MNVGLSTLYDIGSNYSIQLNDKEVLVYEEDKTYKKDKNPQETKLEKDQEKQSKETSKTTDELNEDEKKVVRDLQSRDSEVKAHEAAHQAAGGGMTGAASYSYQQGPDGKMYAIVGEVSISMKSGSSPEENVRNARQIIAAAMAPGNPSPQDYSVASSAKVMEMKALQQIAKQQQEEISGKETYGNQANKKETSEDLGGIDIPA